MKEPMPLVSEEIGRIAIALDGSGSEAERAAVKRLRVMLQDEFSKFLLEIFKKSKDWRRRSSCIYYCFRDAQTNRFAKEIGIEGLNDRSKNVRYRACQLLAYSQDRNLIPRLELSRSKIKSDSLADLEASIDAILNQNQNYFKDRQHSGKIFMDILESN
jgi:hypothetical protein